ncbi:MAG: hypothetical protein JHC95_02825 [Solirubrobacteraceae bacterium]|nr:hypothetical protein [Solirubrobacteraceae bacterium]
MDWTFIWLMFVLKIPIVALLWIVWWAVHATPESDMGDEKDGGSPKPKTPRPPRTRGPHGEPMPPAPQRSRSPGRPRVTGRT